jgi:hypothetical protein
MYRPNFCSHCGAKIVRLQWHLWTSRRFCDACSAHLRRERLIVPLIAGCALLSIGVVAGRAARPRVPPLVIERSANSPLYNSQAGSVQDHDNGPAAASDKELKTGSNFQTAPPEEVVYICGARTKKGTPCSRRVRGSVRCWQHKGLPAMLPAEKLVVKE